MTETFSGEERVHEFLHTYGKIINTESHITHKKPKREVPGPGRNARIYEALFRVDQFRQGLGGG